DVVVRDLGDATGINPARDGLHVHHFAFEAAEKILKVLSWHSSLRFSHSSTSQKSSGTCPDLPASQNDRPSLRQPAAAHPLHSRSAYRKSGRHLQHRQKSELRVLFATSSRGSVQA